MSRLVRIGSFKLYHGDNRDILPTLKDDSVSAVITDPPWNVGKDYGTYKDNLSYQKYTDLIEWNKDQWNRISGNRVAIVLGSEILKQWWDSYDDAKVIICKVGAIVMSKKNNFHLQWKAILTTMDSLEFQSDHWDDIRWPGEGYFFNEPRYGHPAMTPLKLMVRLIRIFTKPGDTILEPYMGSGTTGVACYKTGRNFIGIEIDSDYFDTAVRRITEAQQQLIMQL